MPTPMPDPAAVTDFWGVVVPAWAGAVGTVAASVVAVVALVKGQSAKAGVQNIADGLNESTAEPQSEASASRSERIEQLQEHILNAPLVRWRLLSQARHRYRLLNDSGSVAHVRSVEDISDGHRDALDVPVLMPVDIGPGVTIPFTIRRSLASPAVTAVEVAWTETHNDRIHQTVFYV